MAQRILPWFDTWCTLGRVPGAHDVATFTKLKPGSWKVQVRRKGKYVNDTFRRRRDAEEWALEVERRIDRGQSPRPHSGRDTKTFGDLVRLHRDDLREIGEDRTDDKLIVAYALDQMMLDVSMAWQTTLAISAAMTEPGKPGSSLLLQRCFLIFRGPTFFKQCSYARDVRSTQ